MSKQKSPSRAHSPVPYEKLTPECLFDAVETTGIRCDGRLNTLNSYENRVYQVWLESGEPRVIKFYRPHRWTEAAIEEEHDLALEMLAAELPVVAPILLNGHTLHQANGFFFALYPLQGGRAPEFEDDETLKGLGRFIARMHLVGGVRDFEVRPSFNCEEFGYEPVEFLLQGDFIPMDLRLAYESTVNDVLNRVSRRWDEAGAFNYLRLHGDCHAGNILCTEAGVHFVDLDDARMGPAIQDIWMWLGGEREIQQQRLLTIIEGYKQFESFNSTELLLIEPLRTLRMIHYAGWLAKRWQDPTFPRCFPYFNTQRYWQDHILALREQAAALDEPPLELNPW